MAWLKKLNYLEKYYKLKMLKKALKPLLKRENQITKINNKGGIKMNIYVLLKRTFDKEDKIVIEDGEILDDEAEFIINPYDEYAVEEANNQRDAHGGEVTVVTIGEEDSEKQLRTAL